MPGKPFQPSLMFAGKAGAYPSEAPQVLHSRVGSWPHLQTFDKTGKRLAKDKQFSLLQKSVY